MIRHRLGLVLCGKKMISAGTNSIEVAHHVLRHMYHHIVVLHVQLILFHGRFGPMSTFFKTPFNHQKHTPRPKGKQLDITFGAFTRPWWLTHELFMKNRVLAEQNGQSKSSATVKNVLKGLRSTSVRRSSIRHHSMSII
jgi:hypothetical protein